MLSFFMEHTLAMFWQASSLHCCCFTLLFLITIQLAEMTTFLEGNPPGPVHTVAICRWETFQPHCGPGYVTIIQNASYGRMSLGRCIKIDMGFVGKAPGHITGFSKVAFHWPKWLCNTGCKTDVTALTEWRCSGRNSCDITLPDDQYEQVQPCLELQSYLNVSYSCLKVLTALEHPCSESHFLKTTLPSGYISSQRTDCQHTNIWLIEAKPGQQVNLTLIDFGVQNTPDNFHFGDLEMCEKYAEVRDSVTGKGFVVCGKRRRIKHILVSHGNAVEIDFSSRSDIGEDVNEFLILFEAIGCPDPPLDSNTWSEREGQKIFVGCRDSGSIYEMICQGHKWIGSYKNCSSDDSSEAASYQEDSFMFSALPKGLVIAAIVAIAIVVGTVIVVVGIIVFKRRRHLDYVDGAYTIPNSEKVYVSPDQRQHSGVNSGGIIHDQQTTKHRQISGYNSKYPGCLAMESGEHQQKHVLEHDYHCVASPLAVQSGTDRRGYEHVWERPLPAPESQHSC